MSTQTKNEIYMSYETYKNLDDYLVRNQIETHDRYCSATFILEKGLGKYKYPPSWRQKALDALWKGYVVERDRLEKMRKELKYAFDTCCHSNVKESMHQWK